jgi:hypothetical protein
MTAIITPDDVKQLYPKAAEMDDCLLQEFICVVNQADQCLAGAGYADCTIALMKKSAVAHMVYSIQMTNFESLRSPTGESVKFRDIGTTGGLDGTAYGRTVLSLDTSGCISGVIENTSASRFLISVGGC